MRSLPGRRSRSSRPCPMRAVAVRHRQVMAINGSGLHSLDLGPSLDCALFPFQPASSPALPACCQAPGSREASCHPCKLCSARGSVTSRQACALGSARPSAATSHPAQLDSRLGLARLGSLEPAGLERAGTFSSSSREGLTAAWLERWGRRWSWSTGCCLWSSGPPAMPRPCPGLSFRSDPCYPRLGARLSQQGQTRNKSELSRRGFSRGRLQPSACRWKCQQVAYQLFSGVMDEGNEGM